MSTIGYSYPSFDTIFIISSKNRMNFVSTTICNIDFLVTRNSKRSYLLLQIHKKFKHFIACMRLDYPIHRATADLFFFRSIIYLVQKNTNNQ